MTTAATTPPPAPNWLPVIPEGLPPELREGRRFVVWRAEWRGDRWTKTPYRPADPAHKAASTRPEDWGTFLQALAVVRAGRADGLGRVQDGTDGLVAVDLDHVLDDAGQLAPWAAEAVRDLDSYTERSPSGHGLRIYVRGACTFDGRKQGPVEVYRAKHYLTLTGAHWAGAPRTIEARQAAIERFVARYVPDPPVGEASHAPRAARALDDAALLERARQAANGDRFRQLYDRGDWQGAGYASQSEADLALCGMLAFWFGRDAEAVDRAFRGSALVREKWLEREDYRQATLAKVSAGCAEVYTASRNGHGRGAPHATPADEPGALAIDPKAPLTVARAYLAARAGEEAVPDLRHWQGDFFVWRGPEYALWPMDDLKADLYAWLGRATNVADGAPIQPNKRLVEHVVDALRAAAHLGEVAEVPAWLEAEAGAPDPRALLACQNGLLHVPTRTLLPTSRRFFTLNALAFDYVPEASEPAAWLAFLQDLWDDDAEAIATLQEFVGLVLTAETHYQKALLIVGPRRSGKGTIGRILAALVGLENVAAPMLASLGRPFGLESLIGKRLALVSDARLGGRADLAAIAENLLRITGEDAISVPRKFKPDFTARLAVRFVLLSNELPAFLDQSGALAGRFIVLRLTRSFFGIEDLTLERRLLGELPGILRWALAGLDRLHARGRFVQPASGAALVAQFEHLAAPVAAFLEERCVIAPGASIECGELYQAWVEWSREQGRAHPGSLQMFGKDLAAACPGVRVIRPRTEGRRARHYEGIRLRTPMDLG